MTTGKYVKQAEGYKAFIPDAFPNSSLGLKRIQVNQLTK